MVKNTDKVEFTKRLKEACLDAGFAGRGLGRKITDALAEQKIKVSGPAVWKWLNSESIPDSSNILALSRWLEVRPEWLEYGRGSKEQDGIPLSKVEAEEIQSWDSISPAPDDEVAIPFFTSIEQAAENGYHINEEHNGFKVRFSLSVLRRYGADPANVMALSVYGDSMSPVIPNGSTVTVDRGHQNIVDGGIYVIKQDELFRIKLLYRQPGKLIVRSFNSAEFADEITEIQNVKIIGRVIHWSVMAW
ncbi:repressor [Xenorhabdus stockiae]|uniref:Repressor n=1 Tax=Xenorhabdus stockiae TaxID=351614 RepID=A0A2D0KVW1_9GAMM|nr:S24 family peptidase [Xenorhabdus stockiae]PHM67541.1 repressor [Xenorhabdus stockiae]